MSMRNVVAWNLLSERIARRAVLGTAVAVLLLATATARADWARSWDAAIEESRSTGLPLLVHFHSRYCGPCRRMDREVFQALSVRRALSDGLVAVDVDVAVEPELAERFGAVTVPRDVLVHPDGRYETLNVGFRGRDGYLGMLRSIARTSRPPVVVHSAGTESETASGGETSRSDADTKPLIGLGGYCPVTMTTRREWVTGREEYRGRYRDIEYLFSSADALETFQGDPSRYVPQVLGCDPVVLFESDRAIRGELEYGAFFDSRLYLFRSEETRAAFRRDPLKYTRIRHALNVKQIERTPL